MKTASSTLAPVALSVFVGMSAADAVTVKVGMALDSSFSSSYAPPPAPPRASGSAMPTNVPVSGQISQPAPQPESTIAPAGGESTAPSGGGRASSGGSQSGATQGGGSGASGGGGHKTTTAPVAPAGGAKGGMAPVVEYEDPGALKWEISGGWSSEHLWRGIDLVQFTSYNRVDRAYGNFGNNPPLKRHVPDTKEANSDIVFLGVDAKWQGFDFGIKYIRSWDDDLNPYYAPLATTTDNYEEWVFTVNYTRGLIADNWLVGTFGFDFYAYPNGEFWGVDHQGMLYARLSVPRYKWAQPFLDLFYNVPTTTSGNGLATGALPLGGRNATGADLVEGWGAEFGVRGGDQIATVGNTVFGVSYSLSSIYKNGYAFESDGLSHVIASLSFPITISDSVVISPAVTYVHSLDELDSIPGTVGFASEAWNEPGWSASVRLSFSF